MDARYCTRCGMAVATDVAFCGRCGASVTPTDSVEGGAVQAGRQQPEGGVTLAVVAAVLVVAAIIGGGFVWYQSRQVTSPTATIVSTLRAPTSVPTPSYTLAPTANPTPPPTPEPTFAGPKTYAVGEPVYLTNNGEPWANITISDVRTASSYKGTYGYVEKPQTRGWVFIQAKVTYEALADGVDYNPYDWQVFVDGSAVSSHAFVLYGPKPDLSSGSLPNGRKASGYVVYEVPAKGEIRMSYGNSFTSAPPVFEVVIRAS